ncbi:hypothetical protein CRENBAI_005696 [Crenichthys baileyi]|uniref:Uncharacterized protein n=1 Tax=Crenichthys baileyi TaxID=28760 RepID=A0AAV9S225_9TELE
MDLTDEHQAGSMDLFTFLSREAEKTLRRSPGLSVAQSAYHGSRLAIPCPGTGPLRRHSPPALLAAHSGPAAKPSSSSHRRKRSKAVLLPSSFTHTKPHGHVSRELLQLSPRHHSPRQVYSLLQCFQRGPWAGCLHFLVMFWRSPRVGCLHFLAMFLRGPRVGCLHFLALFRRGPRAVEQPTSGLKSAAAAAVEQPTSGLQSAAAAAAVEQPTSGLQPAAEFPEGPVGGLPPRPGPEHLLGFLWGVLKELRPDAQPDSPQPGMTPDPKSASTSSTRRGGHRTRGASAQFEGFEEEAPSDPVPEGFKEQFVLFLASEPRDEGSPGSASASECSPGSVSASEGSPGSASASEGLPGSASASECSPGSASASEDSPGSASACEGSPGSSRSPG